VFLSGEANPSTVIEGHSPSEALSSSRPGGVGRFARYPFGFGLAASRLLAVVRPARGTHGLPCEDADGRGDCASARGRRQALEGSAVSENRPDFP
jgi:hypothetical protein